MKLKSLATTAVSGLMVAGLIGLSDDPLLRSP